MMETAANFSRREVLGMLAGGLATSSLGNALPSAATSSRRPNVIVILMDDVGYGDLACLGNPVIKTPNIDALYTRSARFTDFHVSPTCAPTRCSLMTGRYCNSVGVWHTIHGRSLLSPSAVTLAECFKSSGYRTAIYGKWHLGDNYPCRPHDRGFEDAVVCGGGGIWQAPDYFGNDDFDDSYIHNGNFQKYSGFSTDIFFQLTMDFIADAQRQDTPFFCYLATPAAHEPVWSKEKDAAPYQNVQGLPHAGFYGMIANIDENLGKLVRFLDQQGLRENTILVFTSDNGTAEGEDVFNAGLRGAKSSAYEGGHRVPLFLHWPGGGIDKARDIPELTAHIDLLSTLVDLCDLNNRGTNIDGRSWRPLLANSGRPWPERTIVIDSQREEELVKWKDTAVMAGHWRLVNPTHYGNPHRFELYNLQQDPGQQHNVLAQNSELAARLKADYDQWWARVSADGGDYVRIVVGSPQEPVSRLSCMDWHGDGSDAANNQNQIRGGPIGNGFWALQVAQAGRYRFELRRWPREVDLPINATYQNPRPNRETAPGVSIGALQASIILGTFSQMKPVAASDKFVDFEVPLPAGPVSLRTAFYDAVLNERGAYYVYAEKL